MNAKKKTGTQAMCLIKRTISSKLLRRRDPYFSFFGIFAGVIILYYVFAWLCSGLFDSYIALTAKISATILSVLGTDATSSGSAIITPTFILSLFVRLRRNGTDCNLFSRHIKHSERLDGNKS